MKNLKRRIIKLTLAAIALAGMTINFPVKVQAASAGALDGLFDVDGAATTDFGGVDTANDVAIQADGKIVVVGKANLVDGVAVFDFAVVRYNANGSLDTTFNGDGKATTDFGGDDEALSVAIQADGKIVVAGKADPTGTGIADFAIARYHNNGSLDTSFDTDGKVTTDFGGFTDRVNGVAIQTDGRIVVCGSAGGVGGNSVAAARYNTNGSLDTGFNGGGKVAFFGGTTAADIALQSDGKIVLVGQTATPHFLVLRLNTNGALDTTFNGSGSVLTDFGDGSSIAVGVAIQTDGKIVAAGRSNSSNISAVARYNTNGTLDNAFDGDGKLTFDGFPLASERIGGIKLQPDGKIVGALINGNNTPNFGAVRLNPNGSFDAGFGINGIASANLGANAVSSSIAIQDDGNIILSGNSNSNFTVARLSDEIKPTASTDFDGDGFGDYAIFRPSTANWFIMRSSDAAVQILSFGSNGDVPLDGDFDGDGKADMAIYRPSNGEWWFQRSSTGVVHAAQFGAPGDKPVPSDVDKDGKTDFAIWRPSNGNWFVLRSSDGFSSFFSFPFGAAGDIPVGTAIFP